ncbi:MAG: hypothetical protein JNJ54_31670 [Myxococcaceae bacterium]|nr:hypothetical protein [Myxococcaceae bacterium]
MQHVLPGGFVKLRHYGLLAPGNVNSKLVAARKVLEAVPSMAAEPAPANATAVVPLTWVELLRVLTGIDVSHCAKCGGDVSSRPPFFQRIRRMASVTETRIVPPSSTKSPVGKSASCATTVP